MSRAVEKSGRSMLEGGPWRSLLQFALPVMGANVLQQLYNTVDTLAAGNFESQNALSAVGSCAYLTMFYLAIAMGFSNAAGVLTAQRFAAGDEKGMRKVTGAGILAGGKSRLDNAVLAEKTPKLHVQDFRNAP